MCWQILPANIIIKPAQKASTSGWTGAVLTVTAANSHLCVIETPWQTDQTLKFYSQILSNHPEK